MILKTLELENFQCYAKKEGDKFEFSEGLNVIIGDNGAGKSKIYDAFYWVLYDEIFDTHNKEFRKTSLMKSLIVSDKTKAECSIDDSVKAAVRLIFFDENKKMEYTLERSYTIKKIDSGNRWQEPLKSQFTAYKKEYYQKTSKSIDNTDEIERIKRKILPNNIKPYMWFQGEEVAELIDFKRQETLTKAINILSNITIFDEYKKLATEAAEKADKEYRSELRRTSKDKNKLSLLETNNKKLKEQQKRLEKEEKELKNNLTEAKGKKEILLSKLDDAVKVGDTERAFKQKEKELNDIRNKIEDEKAIYLDSLFSGAWVLKGMEGFSDIFESIFDKYERQKIRSEEEHKAEKKIHNELFAILPSDVPEPIYLNKMIEAKKCLICGSDAPEGSPQMESILKKLHNSKTNSETRKNTNKHNFKNELKQLYRHGLATKDKIVNIELEQKNRLEKIKNLNKELKTVENEYEQLKESRKNLIDSYSISLTDSENIVAEHEAHYKRAGNYERKLGRIESDIAKHKEQLAKSEEELKLITPDSMPIYLTEKKKVMEVFKEITASTRDRIFDNLILRLETEANKHFQSMTSSSKSFRGNIKLVKQANGKYMPEVVDSKGKRIYQSNTSNDLLIKLAVIMAIITAKKSSIANKLYTFIADAPLSVLASNYTLGFCKTVSEVYKQSIIMSKDFYENRELRDRLLNEVEKLGSVYVIEPSLYEEERDDRTELFTRIQKIK